MMPTRKQLSELHLKEEEWVDLSFILFQKLNDELIDLSQSSAVVTGLIGLTMGLSYNDLHPTEESRQWESYGDWIRKKLVKRKVI